MKDLLKKEKLKCVFVKPHHLPEIIQIDNDVTEIENRIGGCTERIYIPELGNHIILLARKDAIIFTPEKNRPLFDHDGKPVDCIYGDFFVVGTDDDGFRSLDEKELVTVIRKYEQPYRIIIDETNNHFIACIPESPADSEMLQC